MTDHCFHCLHFNNPSFKLVCLSKKTSQAIVITDVVVCLCVVFIVYNFYPWP